MGLDIDLKTEDLVKKLLVGDITALPKLISLVEKGSPDVPAVLDLIHPHTGNAQRIGITGPPGAGKSTLVESITTNLRQDGITVGVLVVDPSSPFSGGAILGDRVRMRDHYLDQGVFIRSIATRGATGGLSVLVPRALKLLDAAGFDIILLETAGVGQTDLDVMDVVDTVAVVIVPEAGDAIQVMKAGLLEIADIFVVNKSDRSGAKRMANDLRLNVHLGSKNDWWEPPVLLTQGHRNVGIDELVSSLRQHRDTLEKTNHLSKIRQLQRRKEFEVSVREEITNRLIEATDSSPKIIELIRKIDSDEIDPIVGAHNFLDDEGILSP
jgi:LAO/AO transport system kinase